MNHKQIPIFATLLLISAVALKSHVGFCAASGVPKGWFPAGSHPQNYEMRIDTVMKHSGKAGAYIKFIGEKAEGFGTLMQIFKADDYRGKRVRLSAWMKTENADSAQLWMRLDGDKRMLGFDNMDSRPVTGTTEWKKYDMTLDVPEATVNIAFGAFVIKKGQAWVDDYQFEVVGPEVATTNMLTPEQMNEEYKYGTVGNYPKQPANLDYEEGAYPERQAVAVDPKIYDSYVGQYQWTNGKIEVTISITRKGNSLWTERQNAGKFELLPLSATDFFIKDRPMTITFVKNEKGQVTHYIIRMEGQPDQIVKKIK